VCANLTRQLRGARASKVGDLSSWADSVVSIRGSMARRVRLFWDGGNAPSLRDANRRGELVVSSYAVRRLPECETSGRHEAVDRS
jgi:hypothetical protein